MHLSEIYHIASKIIPQRARSRLASKRKRRASSAQSALDTETDNREDVHVYEADETRKSQSGNSDTVSVATFLAGTESENWLGNYCFQDVLTTDGTHIGRVHLAKRTKAPLLCVVKVIEKAKAIRYKQTDHLKTQAHIAQQANHPFIAAYFDLLQDASNLYLAMELVPGGTLQHLLKRSTILPESVAKFYAAEAALALRYLHTLGIVYNDLKPENILLARDGHIKLTNFSCVHAHASSVWTSFCHGHYYISPELLHLRSFNKPADWYSLGVLLYEMLTGFPPYHAAEPVRRPAVLCEMIAKGPSCLDWDGFGDSAKDITFRFLDPNPYRRFGHQDPSHIFNHPFFDEVDWVEIERKQICAPFIPILDHDNDTSTYDRFPSLYSVAQDYGKPASDLHGKRFDQYKYIDLPSDTARRSIRMQS